MNLKRQPLNKAVSLNLRPKLFPENGLPYRSRRTTWILDIEQVIDGYTGNRGKKPDDGSPRPDLTVLVQLILVAPSKGNDPHHTSDGSKRNMKQQEDQIKYLRMFRSIEQRIAYKHGPRHVDDKEQGGENPGCGHNFFVCFYFPLRNQHPANRHEYSTDDNKCSANGRHQFEHSSIQPPFKFYPTK